MEILQSVWDFSEALCAYTFINTSKNWHGKILREDKPHGYCRSYVELEIDAVARRGLAEARTRMVARARAFSEAYEKLVLLRNPRITDSGFAYGLGVSPFKEVALVRALGEFFERNARVSLENIVRKSAHESYVEERIYLGHRVFVAAYLCLDGSVGTGYGCTKTSAVDSARRSAVRFSEFQQGRVSHVVVPHEEISIDNISLHNSFLHCIYVGVSLRS